MIRILNYFSRDQRRCRSIERLRRRLPAAAVAKCEISSEGDDLLRALSCLDGIVQLVRKKYRESLDLVGTGYIPRPVSHLSTELQLQTLVDAILRESRRSDHAPRVDDLITVKFAESGAYPSGADLDKLLKLSPPEDIAKKAGDRLLIGMVSTGTLWADASYDQIYEMGSTELWGLYGRVVRGDTTKTG